MPKVIPLYSRSHVLSDWTCQRKRYWQYEHEGRGITSGNTHLELFLGQTLHDGLAAIAQATMSGSSELRADFFLNIDTISAAAQKQMYETLVAQGAGEDEAEVINFANEQAALVEGLLRGFYKHVWPRLVTQYPKIVAIEKEVEYHHDGMIFMSRPDLVVEDAEGNWYYIEYKSTSSKKENWINSWNTAIQLHSSIRAIEATLGKKPVGVVVIGAYKGFESYGKQSSPFCYSYQRKGNPPFSKDEVAYEYRAGFKRYPTWEMEGGVKAWVEGMPDTVLANQFPQTPVIFVKDEMVDRFFTQRATRELEIEMAMGMMRNATDEVRENILDVSFPQYFEACNPGWGKGCQYRQLCFSNVSNPLQLGYEWRIFHHAAEAKAHGETT